MNAVWKNMIISFIFILVVSCLTGCTPNRNIVKKTDNSQYTNNSIEEFGEETNDFNDDTVQSNVNSSNTLRNDTFTDDFTASPVNKNERYYQTGNASWYGREFHGKTTASGEKFNMYKLSAAHKSLPLGTVVRVHNFSNGKSVVVKINDRGPYKGDRIIDLSYSAARRIGLVSLGEGKVGIEIMQKGQGGVVREAYTDNKIEPVADDLYDDSYSTDNYSLQIGAFYSRKNATRLRDKVQDIVDKPVKIVNENDLYKVRLDGIATKSEAKRLKRVLSQEEIETYLIEK